LGKTKQPRRIVSAIPHIAINSDIPSLRRDGKTKGA